MNGKEKRIIRKEIQFSEDEFSVIQQKSKYAGLQPAVYIREAALKQVIKAALSQQEIDMIQRSQLVNNRMQTNLNQIARLANTHGFIPLYDSIVKLIKNIENYFLTGGKWIDIEIPQNIRQLEDILKDADAKYQKVREAALIYFYYTYEGEQYYKEQNKCSIYSNTNRTKFFFRVEGSDKLAVEIPEKLFNDYKARKASIKDLHDYWKKSKSIQ